MAKNPKQLTVPQLLEQFEALKLPEQINLFAAEKKVLEEKKKQSAADLNSLQSAEIE